jgi:hypothetical protein
MLLSFGATAIFFPSVRQISRRRGSSLFATRQKAEKKIIRLHHRRVRFSQKLLLFRMGILRDFHPRVIVPEIAGINCSVQHGRTAARTLTALSCPYLLLSKVPVVEFSKKYTGKDHERQICQIKTIFCNWRRVDPCESG